MAINLDISENIERIPLSIQSNASPRAISSENGSPYYVGARAYVTQTSNGAVVTVIDKDGTTTATIMNGQDGTSGVGIISITQNADYTLTINLDDGTSYTTEPLKGADGYTPVKGIDYFDGEDGQDGYTPVKGVDYFDGQDGYTPIKGVDYFDGEDGQDGQNGQDGYTPIKGVDYFDGAKGDTGNGIVSTVLNDDYTLTILFSDGTSVTTASIRGAKGEAGTTGATGNGIANIAKTSTSGLVDTYTITYTNGATDTFQVKNGENGSGSVADVWVDGTSVLDGDTAKIDLSGKADASDIPTKVSDLTNDSGFITGYTETDPAFLASAAHGITSSNISTWNGKYTKPSTGIPKTDLATAVQTSLGKADTALQSYTETDPTVPAWAKAASKPSYTASEVGALPASTSIPSKTSDLTNDSGFITGYTETDPVFSASAAHGISSSDIANWNSKQAALESGTNIKTVNGVSILGRGDIPVASSGTSTPTADTVAEFDASAHMNSTDMTSQEVSNFVNSLITQGVSLIDLVYPIGSYYETSDSTFNPNATWGGTWVLEAEGLVHIGAGANYLIGDTGGEAEVTLTVDEMPSHNHTFNYAGIGVASGSYAAGLTAQTGGLSTANRGGGQAHNNMQPYIVVNRWHRTA